MDSRYVFLTERGGSATTAGFLKTISRIGVLAVGSLGTVRLAIGQRMETMAYAVIGDACSCLLDSEWVCGFPTLNVNAQREQTS